MEKIMVPLHELPLGETARIVSLHTDGKDHRRLLDLGLVQGTLVESLQKSPWGDPTAYFVRGAVIALRREDAEKIKVSF